ncbi:MAG: fibronectin type III domain-containing protein [Paludibacter sp.]
MKTSTFQIFFAPKTFILVFFCLCYSVSSFGLIVISNAPTYVSASVASSTSAKVNFIVPTYSGTGTINYTVTSSPGNVTATGTATGITVSGLTSGTAYTFTVRAVGDGGGDFTSTASNSITPKTISTITWSGSTSTNWATASNWTGGVLPGINNKVSIPTGKTVVIAVGSTISVNSITIAGTGKLTNNGTLNVVTQNSDNAIAFSSATTAYFDNEGTLTLNTSAGFNNVIGTGGTASLIFNGTVNIVAGASKSVISASGSSTTTISGSGFTIGSSGAQVNYSLVTATSTNAAIIISAGTTLSAYINANNAFYLSSSASITNNGTINTYTTTTGTSLHALQIWETTAGLNSTFTNNGTFLMSGFEQPTVFGGSNTGSTGYCKFENKVNSTTTINYTGTSGSSLGIFSLSNLPNVFINSGTLNINVSYRAISLNAKSYGGSFTNTGTINITKGNITSGGTVGTASTYQTIDNNSGGIINFNYGIPSSTTNAANAVTINNNSGATINGSCTFPASTLSTNAGSTLSPGDYDTVNKISGIGIMVLIPSATGTKFPLAGSLNMLVNNKTTAGTDYDQLQCSELDLTNSTLSATVNYTPSNLDYIPLTYSTVSKTGSFLTASIANGWIVDASSATNVAIKYDTSLPFAPTIGTAVGWNKKATVSFTAPGNAGISAITGYTVTSNPGGITATGTTSPITVNGLTNGTSYTFTVTATNQNGTSSSSAASNAITPALNDLRTVLDAQSGSSSINIPKGSYSLTLASGAYQFSGLSNVTVEGNGSEIICDKQSLAFRVINCTNFKMSNLSVDYDPLCFTQGIITAVSSDHLTWTVKICNGYPLTDISTNKLELFDKNTLTLKENYWTIYSGFTYIQSSDVLTITKTSATSPYSEAVGDYAVFDVKPVNTETHGIYISGSKNLIMDNVTMYGSNCFSFYESDCENSTYNRCKVTRKTDDQNVSVPRLRSGNADGIHSKHATVGPTITNCRVEYNSDDCIAVNGNFYPVYNVDQANGYLYLLSSSTTPKVQNSDSIVLVDNNGTIIGNSKALTLTTSAPTTTEISNCIALYTGGMSSPTSFIYGFRISIPAWYTGLSIGDLIYSKARTGNNFKIENDTVGYNRSRGILVKASNGTIKNNYVRGSMEAGIVLAPEFYWMEAGCSSNVEISNNLISKCMFEASSWGQSQAAPLTVISFNGSKAISAAGGFTNISIHDNIITGCPKPNVVLTSINGYSYYNNQLTPDLTMVRQHGKNYGITNTDDVWTSNLSGLQSVVTNKIDLKDDNFTFYFNSNSLSVEYKEAKLLKLQLFNVNGLLLQTTAFTKQTNIELNNYPHGVYIIQISTEGILLNRKIVI